MFRGAKCSKRGPNILQNMLGNLAEGDFFFCGGERKFPVTSDNIVNSNVILKMLNTESIGIQTNK